MSDGPDGAVLLVFIAFLKLSFKNNSWRLYRGRVSTRAHAPVLYGGCLPESTQQCTCSYFSLNCAASIVNDAGY